MKILEEAVVSFMQSAIGASVPLERLQDDANADALENWEEILSSLRSPT